MPDYAKRFERFWQMFLFNLHYDDWIASTRSWLAHRTSHRLYEQAQACVMAIV